MRQAEEEEERNNIIRIYNEIQEQASTHSVYITYKLNSVQKSFSLRELDFQTRKAIKYSNSLNLGHLSRV